MTTNVSKYLLILFNPVLLIYVIFLENFDWRCDQLRWCNIGNRRIPADKKKECVFKVIRHHVYDENGKPNKGFQRTAYHHLPTNLVIVNYVGDKNVAGKFPHGNSLKPVPFTRTAPSVIDNFKKCSK